VTQNGINTDKGGDGIGMNGSSYVSVLYSDIRNNRGRGVDIAGGVYVKIQQHLPEQRQGSPQG
jgi:hypothetical protein